MIPILYEKDGVTKGSMLDDSVEIYVTEERNGDFELELTYPVAGDVYKSLDKEKIIVCDANDYLKNQLFRIYNIRKTMKNRVKVYAKHISFDLAHDWIDSISLENQSCEYALNRIFRNSQFCQHYKGYSDIINAQNFKVNKVTCLKAIAGTSGSIIDTYGTGAEILRDNTNIHVLNHRGHDNDVVIEYRKNLTGLEVQEDTIDLVTRIMPYAIYTDEDSQEVEVRGDFIDSPLINNYAHPYVKYIDYSDKFEDDEIPTKTKLNNLATTEYTVNKVDIPKCNYKIEFIPLSKCAGYEGLDDRINLCDIVTVKDTRYNIDTQAKVIKVTYNVLRDRYESMELGEPKTTLGDIIGNTGNGPIQGPPGPPGPQGQAGVDGSIGDFPESLPAIPEITAKVYGFANIELTWNFENKVYYSYELYASKTKGFVPNIFNLLFAGQASTFLHQVQSNETWYYRACAINTHGQRTAFSDEIQVKTVKISDLSNYVESAAIGDALIGELRLDRGWVGQLRGNLIDAKQLSVTDGNGKRTLDIDSFGNVNLDVASLKIKSHSVATGADVDQAKKDAISSAESKINIAKDSIAQSVSENYYSKNEFANSSVLNLIMNGGFENGTEHWERNKDFTDSKDIWFPHDSGASWVIWADRHSGFYQRFSCIIDKTYSWSADVYIEAGCGNIGIEGLTSRYWYEGGWTKISGTFTATSTIHTFIIYGDYDTTTIIHIDNIMVCEGAIPHPYQPNYIDINSRLRLAEQKITPDAIVNTVRHEVYTKSETEDVINNKGYATQAQVTHTAEQVEYRFSQSGGYNVTRNGGFENGMTHWSMNNNPNILENQPWQNYDGKSLWISATSHGSGIFQFFPTTVGKVYSYSFYAQAEYGEWWAGVENAHTQTVSVSPNNWIRYTGTFTATSTSHAFVCYAYGGGRNVFIDNVMICEGVLPSAFTPHPSEVYEEIINMDKDGLTVTHGDSYSRLDARGLMRYDGDNGKYYHYLSYMGQVDLASEERATIQLPSEFKNRDFKVIVSVKRVRMNYDPYVEKHLLMGFYAEVNSINTANATFEVYASVRAIKSTNFNGSITGADYGHDTLRPVVAYWVYA